ncbi:ribosomal protein S18-alanine N-acetyltransferase [Phenylobacterium deserti]|uniref:[Ribosomal protein bS18]-alanine N-acetyltransferase n=1 Tax=Phenylobacterium deserti TaxID=1914756 RepID=A0A328ARP7_9CAUL|nr:ribosomal protein S18-alanine N-acetyltransferase [Phenylobacterium deserti]RAK57229.1 ribosomal-protein-alanine N-acetyltransferase [Phenylobacterium deserti]
MSLAFATPGQAATFAAVHARAFPSPWGASEFEELLASPGVFGLLHGEAEAIGLVLCRIAAGEMEVLTLGVSGEARRSGVGRQLMLAALASARQLGAQEAFLEVAVDNDAAVALYESLGFSRAGLRRAYYDRGTAGRVDALVMRLDLSAPAA